MKIVVLDAQTLGYHMELSRFKKFGELTVYPTSSPQELLERVADVDIAITNKGMFSEKVFAEVRRLRLLCLTATGHNNVDLAAAEKRGVAVSNVAGYSTFSVAQHTFAMLFYLLQQLAYYDAYVKNKSYVNSPTFTHLARSWYELDGKKWGIIGLGNIGRRVGELAQAFGMELSYYSTSGKNNQPLYTRVSIESLLKESDIVSIHAPLNEKTRALINYDRMKLMKRNALLLNLGRGGIVVEEDLTRALNEDLIRGACLDVLDQEPMAVDSPLHKVENPDKLLITPHIAWGSIEARTLLMQMVEENIQAFLDGQRKNRLC